MARLSKHACSSQEICNKDPASLRPQAASHVREEEGTRALGEMMSPLTHQELEHSPAHARGRHRLQRLFVLGGVLVMEMRRRGTPAGPVEMRQVARYPAGPQCCVGDGGCLPGHILTGLEPTGWLTRSGFVVRDTTPACLWQRMGLAATGTTIGAGSHASTTDRLSPPSLHTHKNSGPGQPAVSTQSARSEIARSHRWALPLGGCYNGSDSPPEPLEETEGSLREKGNYGAGGPGGAALGLAHRKSGEGSAQIAPPGEASTAAHISFFSPRAHHGTWSLPHSSKSCCVHGERGLSRFEFDEFTLTDHHGLSPPTAQPSGMMERPLDDLESQDSSTNAQHRCSRHDSVP
ncbi:hypothetical protein Micbo1qcDRAFT_196417 [Microdochium bolleyi]|uniref:Uncharacterized protein n=1 Tax=Microdochium bolleyi TaxID=196109 RepID=A0A136IZS1_9PEZI|nr:hypothetical protein Micbo1qcDRAFT_196417 [Microdochium bolleyi]